MKRWPYLLCSFCLLFSSCLKEEAPNAECDITQSYVRLPNPEAYFFQVSDTLQRVAYADSTITFGVRRTADCTQLAPHFVLTDGATIAPASGSTHDFSQGSVIYTVTSEDRLWQRRYTVSFTPITRLVSDTVAYDFERFELNPMKKYYLWYEEEANGTRHDDWATGNPGFAISMSSAQPADYPSTPATEGYDGACVRLVTRSTGPFGALAGMRIAAGNLFLGSFDVTQALKSALTATRFGIPFAKRPVRLTGYFTYTAGENFQNKQGVMLPDSTDSGHIYAVLYRNHDDAGNSTTLDGSNVLTSPLIVALADVPHIRTTDGWQSFDVAFDYRDALDARLLAAYGYNLALVFSSSTNGNLFEGAVGSTLCVDKVRIICNIEE